MKYALRTENLSLSDFDHQQLDKKLDRLHKHLLPPYTVDVTLIHDHHHNKGQVVTCTINIKRGKKVLHAKRVAQSAQDGIDQAILAIKHELEKEHDKKKKHHL